MRDVIDLVPFFAAIDDVNSGDPNRDADRLPVALVQGQKASRWARALGAEDREVLIAARAHHLRRWEVARSDFADGRDGYLRWRRTNKAHQAEAAATLMREADFSPASIARVEALLLRRGLGVDPGTQIVEDAACLVFIESQFDEMVARLGHDHMVEVVVKTLRKMSDDAIELAGDIPLSDSAQRVLTAAVERL